MKKYCNLSIVLGLCVFSTVMLSAQAASTSNTEANEKETSEEKAVANPLLAMANPQIAMANPGYLVTAGDVYTLAYAAGTVPVTYTLPVDTSYKIRVSNLAVLDTAGKTYLELKNQVEAVVTKNYPMSGVQFILRSPAMFTVTVNGEVNETAEPSAWALTRLSAVVGPSLTPYSSIRDITITSISGLRRSCDLYKAQRLGDLGEDPYLRPGDVITVNRLSRLVTVNGAVERPGTYQLKEGEELSELIRNYGSGFTPVADSSRMELVRHVESDSVSGNKLYLDSRDITANFSLKNFDVLSVPAITELLPVMFVEGAIGATVGVDPESSTRVPVRFNAGENYASLVSRNRAWFSAVSDTANAYLVRSGTRLPLNLNPMLYDASYRSQYLVEQDDTLVIPFRQYYVTVSGAVAVPGRYPYIPDRDWSYYINLAGGFDPTRNSFERVTITDLNGKKQDKKSLITPETNIMANNNAFLYYFNQYAPIVTTTLTVITTVFTVIAVTGN